MRHVAVMTVTGSIGLTFLFLVDFASLFYVSLLGRDVLTAGVGFAGAVQFFTVSVCIGLSIAAMALVSRAIGARETGRARQNATSALMISISIMVVIAFITLLLRYQILALIGAKGEAAQVAADFLMISLPSLPFVGTGMVTASILRAEGDARAAMMVTVTGGAAAMVLDPLLIFRPRPRGGRGGNDCGAEPGDFRPGGASGLYAPRSPRAAFRQQCDRFHEAVFLHCRRGDPDPAFYAFR